MFTIIIDTSFSPSFFALAQGDKILISEEIPSLETTRHLLPSIVKIFTGHNLTMKDISQIAVCNGPGSYTGTRTGVMTAKALAFHTPIKLISYHSLLPYQSHAYPPILNANRGKGLTLVNNIPQVLPFTAIEGLNFVSPHPEEIFKHLPNAHIKKVTYDFDPILEFMKRATSEENMVTNYL